MSKEQGASFVKGAAILGAGALVSKMLGVIYRIPYQNITGDLGYYVYTQVYPLYSALLILATAGFPIAISKMVAEKLALGDVNGARRIFIVAAVLLSITGVVFFILLWIGAPVIAAWMRDPKLTMPIRSVSFALLLVPIMAAMRGYFQGHHNMVPTAVSQIFEQLVRVMTIIILAYYFMKTTGNVYIAGSGAVFGAVTGAFVSLFIMLLFLSRNRRIQKETMRSTADGNRLYAKDSTGSIIRQIVYYAIPICMGSLVLPLMQLSDSFTVVNMLLYGGFSHQDAYNLKGIFDRGQPLVQFGAFFATALSLSIVPAIAEARARGQHRLIASRSELALRLTFLVGLPCSVGLAVVAGPVNIMLYQNGSGTTTLILLAFTTIFSTLGITSSGILQGMGRIVLPVRNLALGALLKIVLNLLLIPFWGISGAALSTVFAFAVSALLNLYAVSANTGMRFTVRSFFVKPILAVSMMGLAAFIAMRASEQVLAEWIHSERLYYSAVSVAAVAAGVAMYGIALFVSGTVSRSDLEGTSAGRKLIPFLTRLRLLHD
jgi:O-antigen/teichoic acid export membrane protein